jgi:acyl-CoA reductase-like NAD-dependent aldehyde dehydrogenase
MLRFADLLESESASLSPLLTAESGKTLAETAGEVACSGASPSVS